MQIVKLNDLNYKDQIDATLNRKSQQSSEIDAVAAKIIQRVKTDGDRAIFELAKELDKAELKSIRVPMQDIERAYAELDEDLKRILHTAKSNIETFHRAQLEKSWFMDAPYGSLLGQRITPIDRVAIYAPGGTAAYPSTVLMNVIPAKVAGVPSIAICTPPNSAGVANPVVLAAAYMCGIDEVYLIGGAAAVAAMAYGTQTIQRADKLTGPGNAYFTSAKKQLYGEIAIDMIAGPSEILIVADSTADERLIAADMLSQAEHDRLASAVLITTDTELAKRVEAELAVQLAALPRAEIASVAIKNHSAIFIAENTDLVYVATNYIAPEHLELMVENPMEKLPLIRNAGSIFLGKYSPEPLGDYMAGPNHTLPTSSNARHSSTLGTDAFVKKSNVIYYTKDALAQYSADLQKFAEAEGLSAHARAVKIRDV